MLVHRIEHVETGLGPFKTVRNRDENLYDLIKHMTQDLQTYPSPNEDKVVNPKDFIRFNDLKDALRGVIIDTSIDCTIFGCKTLDELYSWFHNGLISKLSNMGFNYTTYEVEDSNLILLQRQCIILDKTQAVVKTTQSLKTLIRG